MYCIIYSCDLICSVKKQKNKFFVFFPLYLFKRFTLKLTFLSILSTILLMSSTEVRDFQCMSPMRVMLRAHFISSYSTSMAAGGITCFIITLSPLPDLDRRRFSALRDRDLFRPLLRSRSLSLSFFFFGFFSSTSVSKNQTNYMKYALTFLIKKINKI